MIVLHRTQAQPSSFSIGSAQAALMIKNPFCFAQQRMKAVEGSDVIYRIDRVTSKGYQVETLERYLLEF